jgi:Uma2 family endonuclease
VPDAFVVKGVSPNRRRTYKIWLEGKAPDVVIETTSRKTRRKDTTTKPELYARQGVKEYFLFDPDGENLDPPLQGYRLRRRTYVRLKPDQDGGLTSRELGLRLRLWPHCCSPALCSSRLAGWIRNTGSSHFRSRPSSVLPPQTVARRRKT